MKPPTLTQDVIAKAGPGQSDYEAVWIKDGQQVGSYSDHAQISNRAAAASFYQGVVDTLSKQYGTNPTTAYALDNSVAAARGPMASAYADNGGRAIAEGAVAQASATGTRATAVAVGDAASADARSFDDGIARAVANDGGRAGAMSTGAGNLAESGAVGGDASSTAMGDRGAAHATAFSTDSGVATSFANNGASVSAVSATYSHADAIGSGTQTSVDVATVSGANATANGINATVSASALGAGTLVNATGTDGSRVDITAANGAQVSGTVGGGNVSSSVFDDSVADLGRTNASAFSSAGAATLGAEPGGSDAPHMSEEEIEDASL